MRMVLRIAIVYWTDLCFTSITSLIAREIASRG